MAGNLTSAIGGNRIAEVRGFFNTNMIFKMMAISSFVNEQHMLNDEGACIKAPFQYDFFCLSTLCGKRIGSFECFR